VTQALAAEILKHSHRFAEGNPLAEKSTLRVAVLTAVMMVLGLMIYQSVEKLISPRPIHYDQAIALGLYACSGRCGDFGAGDRRAVWRKNLGQAGWIR